MSDQAANHPGRIRRERQAGAEPRVPVSKPDQSTPRRHLTPCPASWETAKVLEQTTSPLQPSDPEALGPYRVASRLGSGGMGTVYLAHAPDGRPVAIKVIRPELARDPAFRARFAAEVDAARRVTASCTARVLDAEPAATLPWFVTEYVEGTPLDRLVAAGGPLPPSSVEGLAVGVAAALTAIHAAGLVHRDLKPGNVLVSPFGPKVIDFGIARAMDAAGSVTLNGMVLGTPGWMAPEQLAGLPTSPSGDVFAWGCLVAFAASGVAPFGEGPPEVVAQRVARQPPQLAGVPESLRGLVTAATDRDPAKRPAARELLLELLGDPAASDQHAAVTQALQRTWIAPAAGGRVARGAAALVPAQALPAAAARRRAAAGGRAEPRGRRRALIEPGRRHPGRYRPVPRRQRDRPAAGPGRRGTAAAGPGRQARVHRRLGELRARHGRPAAAPVPHQRPVLPGPPPGPQHQRAVLEPLAQPVPARHGRRQPPDRPAGRPGGVEPANAGAARTRAQSGRKRGNRIAESSHARGVFPSHDHGAIMPRCP